MELEEQKDMEEPIEFDITKEKFTRGITLLLAISMFILAVSCIWISIKHDQVASDYNQLIDYIENSCTCIQPFFK